MIYIFTSFFILIYVITFFWNNIFNALNLKKYNGLQRAHDNEIPRIGGILIYLVLWVVVYADFLRDDFLKNILLSSIPMVFFSIIEDVGYKVKPIFRLCSMITSIGLFFFINPLIFPIINFPILGPFFSVPLISIFFFGFCSLIMINGNNLIDGMNGLSTFTIICQFASLLYLSLTKNNTNVYDLLIILNGFLLIFLYFNFTNAKIFIGDTGAYFFGFLSSILTIYLFGLHSELLSWLAVLILFYPCIEMLFSFLRKISTGLSPMSPDNKHLHSLIFRLLLKSHTKIKANYLTTIYLSIFWLTPFLINVIFHFFQLPAFFIFIAIFLLTIIYIFLYFYINFLLGLNDD